MFVARLESGLIYGAWTCRQWVGQEQLPDEHPEVLAFKAPKRNAAIKAQLAEIDRRAGGGRGLREFVIAQSLIVDEHIARGNLPPEASMSDNVGIVKIKQAEAQAAALRAQLLPE